MLPIPVIVFLLVPKIVALKYVVCSSNLCKEYVNLFRETLNESVDPCYDFDGFVCDGWRDHHKRSFREELYQTFLDTMAHLVKQPDSLGTGRELGDQARLLYRSCYSVLLDGVDDTPTLRTSFDQAGITWPRRSKHPDVLDSVMRLQSLLNWPTVLSITASKREHITLITMDPSNTFQDVISIHERLARDYDKKEYFQVLQRHFSNRTYVGVTFLEMRAVDAYATAELKNVLQTTSPSPRLRSRVLPDSLAYNKKANLSNDRWDAYLNRHFPSIVTGANESVQFVTHHLDFLVALFNVWSKLGDPDMHLYVSWCAVQYAAAHFVNRDCTVNYYGSVAKARYLHEKFCLLTTYRLMGDATLASYGESVFTPAVEDDSGQIMLSVQNTLTERLSARSPFSEHTAALGDGTALSSVFRLLKLKGRLNSSTSGYDYLNLSNSFLSNWKKITIDKQSFDVVRRGVEPFNFFESNFYEIQQDDLLLAPFVLSYPLYCVGAIAPIKYGGLGGIVSAGLAKMVIHKYMTNNDTVAALNETIQCLKPWTTPQYANIESVLSDVVSLEVLLRTCDNVTDCTSKTLHDFKYSGTQLLFIMWCYIRCPSSGTPDDHERCNEVLAQTEHFSKAFRCQPGTPLNPPSKCKVP